jgi:hypothetical protein
MVYPCTYRVHPLRSLTPCTSASIIIRKGKAFDRRSSRFMKKLSVECFTLTPPAISTCLRYAIASQTKLMANSKKLKPATVLSVLGDTCLPSHLPATTPRKLVVTRAIAAPRNTISGDFDSAAIINVVICVLSPSSAKNTVKNVVVAI